MALALEKFFCCLELQLGAIIMAWWGMIGSAISVVLTVIGLLFGERYYNSLFPFHISTGGAVVSALLAILFFVVYCYFSYQLLQGSQSGNSSQMIGYLIIHGILVVLFVIAAFKSPAVSLLMAGLYVYLWICVYSFYVKSGGNVVV